jgi:hypothetical protein
VATQQDLVQEEIQEFESNDQKQLDLFDKLNHSDPIGVSSSG